VLTSGAAAASQTKFCKFRVKISSKCRELLLLLQKSVNWENKKLDLHSNLSFFLEIFRFNVSLVVVVNR
jgi:hypothetical protein